MPLGKKIKMYYDPRGQAIKTINPDDSLQTVFFGEVSDLANPQNYSPTPWVSFSYDANDNGDRRSGGKGLTPASNINTPKSAEIDALGRTIKTTEHDAHLDSGTSTYVDVVMEYSYDIRGNQLTVTDPNNRTAFEYKYDYANRNLWTDHIDSGISSINMDVMGKPVEAVNAKGGETLSSYDVLNRPIRLWAKDDSAASFTLRQYPIYGDDTSATGKTVQQTKDLNLYGQGWKFYDEAGMVHTEDYDFKGNLLEKSRQVIKDSELLSVFNGQGPVWQVNPYIVDWTGLPVTILDSSVMVTSMTYDALNRAMNVMYPEDVNGNRKILTPTYNKAGIVKSVDFDGTDYIKEIAYDAKGQPLLTAYGNNIMTRYAYDENTFRVVRMKSESYNYTNTSNNPTYSPSGNTQQDFAYKYDLVGNIMELHDRTPNCGTPSTPNELNKIFDYDPLYRVISASGRESTNQGPGILWGTAPAVGIPSYNSAQTYTQTFQYDKLGNMQKLKQIGTNSYTRNYVYSNYANDNKLTKIEGTGSPAPVYSNFSYDANGNMISSDLDRSYIWDAADQLRAFSIQAGTGEPSIYAQYLYSGGQRIKKIVRTTGGDYEVTVYDGAFEYMKKVSGGSTYEKNYTHIEGAATVRTGNGTPFPGDITDDIVYNLGDNIGSINVRLSTTGTLIDREEYYPFGDTSLRTFTYKRYRYVNKQKDSESGLYYYGARYYASWTCRFISVDPLAGKFAHITGYNYADNNPINDFDIDGMQTKNTQNTPEGNSSNNTPKDFTSESGQKYTWIEGDNCYEVCTEVTVTAELKNKDFGSKYSGFNAYGMDITNPKGGQLKIPDNSIPFLNSSGQVTGFIAYGGTVFIYDDDPSDGQDGYQDTKGRSLYYYEKDYDDFNEGPEWAFWLKKVFSDAGSEALQLVGDPKKYTKELWTAIKEFDVVATANALSNLKSDDYKYLGASILSSLITTNPKQAIWTLGRFGDAAKNLAEHWKKHKKDFKNLKNSTDYVKAVYEFTRHPPKGTQIKIQGKGDIAFWDKKSNNFAVVDKTGTPRTFYKPDLGEINAKRLSSGQSALKSLDDWWALQPAIRNEVWIIK